MPPPSWHCLITRNPADTAVATSRATRHLKLAITTQHCSRASPGYCLQLQMNRQPITARSELEHIIFDETAEPKALRLSLLEDITNGFSDGNEIGYGGFARVYKGMLDNGKVVAVKKLFGTVDIDEKKFIQEVCCLMKAKQKNIVRFLGYCSDTQGEMLHFEGKLVLAEVRQKVLCFEYLPNGSLDKQIADASCGLEWTKRYQIITGICDGLHYLHQKRILHLDLKPANILLDDNMMPKITDFGLSRIFDEKQSRAITSKLIGTLGYLAPEFYGGHITFKLDIYSLGIIIIEMLIGEKGYPNIDNVLETWRNRLEKTQREAQLVQVRVCTEIAIQCTHSDPAKRPDTQHIVDRLGAAKSVDESAAETGASCCSLVMQETGSTICLENTMANEVNKLAEELYNIKVQNRRFSSMPENSSIVHHITDIRETPSNVEESLIIGRAEEKKKLMAALSGSITPEFTVLPIYGIGGIGKTTLAQLVFNDSQFIGYSRVWVSGQNLDLNKIGNSIISQLSEEILIAEKQMIDNHLKELLSGKKILIVLDDVWEKNPDTINTLKAMLRLGASSSVTTIVTTRNKAIAREICHTVDPYKLETLTDKICWTIIKQKTAFKERVDKKQLKHIGREIAIKCGGVALAAQSLGYTLNGKTSDEWESVRDNSIWNISTSENPSSRNHEVLASLLLSFTYMSECLKLCFSYLAVYPKGHSIMKCDLIYQWITLGFIGPSSLFDSVQLCEIFITELLGMSFLQYSKTRSSDGRQDKDITSFTMPDLVHDLARNVLANLINISRGNRNTCALLTDSSKPLQSSMISPANLEALHFVDCGKIELLGDAFSPANRILVSDLRACLHVMVKIGSLLGSIITPSCLEHQDLSWDFVLSCIPKSFDLRNVRALDLEDCIDVKDRHFKYISQLLNLKYLSLGPGITDIAKEIVQLKLLKTLDVTKTRVSMLPVEVIELPCLTHLIGKFTWQDPQRGCQKKSMSKTFAEFAADNGQGLLQLIVHMKKLRKVKIWCKCEESELGQVDMNKHLSEAIQKYIGTPMDEDNDYSLSLYFQGLPRGSLTSLDQLKSLKLHGNSNLATLPKFVDLFQNLFNISIATTMSVTQHLLSVLEMPTLLYLKIVIETEMAKSISITVRTSTCTREAWALGLKSKRT